MNRLRTLGGAVLVVLMASGAATSAQKNPYRNYTEEKFVQNMQSADRNYAAVNDVRRQDRLRVGQGAVDARARTDGAHHHVLARYEETGRRCDAAEGAERAWTTSTSR